MQKWAFQRVTIIPNFDHFQVEFLDASSEKELEPSVVTSKYLERLFDKGEHKAIFWT
jgi:hypothetical protein